MGHDRARPDLLRRGGLLGVAARHRRRGHGVRLGDELELVVATIRAGRYRYAHEEGLQRGIAQALATAGLPVEREVRLPGGLGRIDLVSGRVGIEVKVAGRLEDVTRQCERYLRSDYLDAVVLATIRAKHLPLRAHGPRGKPVVVVSLAHGGL